MTNADSAPLSPSSPLRDTRLTRTSSLSSVDSGIGPPAHDPTRTIPDNLAHVLEDYQFHLNDCYQELVRHVGLHANVVPDWYAVLLTQMVYDAANLVERLLTYTRRAHANRIAPPPPAVPRGPGAVGTILGQLDAGVATAQQLLLENVGALSAEIGAQLEDIQNHMLLLRNLALRYNVMGSVHALDLHTYHPVNL